MSVFLGILLKIYEGNKVKFVIKIKNVIIVQLFTQNLWNETYYKLPL